MGAEEEPTASVIAGVVEFSSAFSSPELARALAFFRERCERERQSFTNLAPADMGGDPDALAELEWLTRKMTGIAAAADRLAGWGLAHGGLEIADDLVYDRFGPAYSDVKFDWHCDDDDAGPRDISVVAYFTDPGAYEGGELELKVPQEEVPQEEVPQEEGPQEEVPQEEVPQEEVPQEEVPQEEVPQEEVPATAPTSPASPRSAGALCVLRRRYCPGAAVAFRSKVLEHRVAPVTAGERRSLLLLCSSRARASRGGSPCRAR